VASSPQSLIHATATKQFVRLRVHDPLALFTLNTYVKNAPKKKIPRAGPTIKTNLPNVHVVFTRSSVIQEECSL
jgi:hypothetical protein